MWSLLAKWAWPESTTALASTTEVPLDVPLTVLKLKYLHGVLLASRLVSALLLMRLPVHPYEVAYLECPLSWE